MSSMFVKHYIITVKLIDNNVIVFFFLYELTIISGNNGFYNRSNTKRGKCCAFFIGIRIILKFK